MYDFVVCIDQECVILFVDEVFYCECFYVGEIYYYVVVGCFFGIDEIVVQCDFEYVVMVVQVFVLVVVIGDVVVCVEFEFLGNQYDVKSCGLGNVQIFVGLY